MRDTKKAYQQRAKQAETWIAEGVAAEKAERAAAFKAAKEAAAKAEAERARYTRDDLIGAVMVRSEIHGWRKVRRVNTKSVTVDSGYSWPDYVPFDKVLEVRK